MKHLQLVSLALLLFAIAAIASSVQSFAHPLSMATRMLYATHMHGSTQKNGSSPTYIQHLARTPDDPNVSQQWALTNIQAFEAWDITTGGPIVVAVIDTGVSATHPDLKDKVLPGYNAVLDNNASDDDHGHGTAIAGLIAARTNNSLGIAGICWDCRILPIKVLNTQGTGEDHDLARGIRWATDNGAQIINLSLGGAEDSQILRDAIQYAADRNVLLIAASGNDRQLGNFTNYPAAYEQVVAVGATTNSDKIAGFSNTGDHVDIAAPGVALWTTTLDGDYGPPNGTSFSSPFVSGVAALVMTLRSDLSSVDIACILKASADDKGTPGKDAEYGWGRLNALKAVQLAQSYTTCPLSELQPQLEPQPEPQPEPQSQPKVDIPLTRIAPPQQDTSSVFAPVTPVASNTQQTYFPETQHILRGEFHHFWNTHGGLPVFGLPISEEFTEIVTDAQGNSQSYIVQYFERYRFEFHPENAPPYNVLLSRLGDDVLMLQGRNWFTFPRSTPKPDCLYFEGTGHTVCGVFLNYWQTHGLELDGVSGKSYGESMALFGQPLSEEQIEEVAPGITVRVQWFERARLEFHENSGVLLGLLGREYVHIKGWD